MKKNTLNKTKYYILGIIFLFIVWGLLSFVFDENNLVFPNMFLVFKETFSLLTKKYTYKCIGFTFVRLAIGFIIAFILAIIIGTISGINNKFKYFIKPIITTIKSIPTASLVFLFIVLSGAKNAPVYIVVLICFPILYEAVVSGLENIDEAILNSLKMEKGGLIKKVVTIRLPLAIPYVIVGVASSLGLSFKIEIMAEILSGATNGGLGSAIAYIQRNNPTDMVSIFAYSLIAVIISLLIDNICEKMNK